MPRAVLVEQYRLSTSCLTTTREDPASERVEEPFPRFSIVSPISWQPRHLTYGVVWQGRGVAYWLATFRLAVVRLLNTGGFLL